MFPAIADLPIKSAVMVNKPVDPSDALFKRPLIRNIVGRAVLLDDAPWTYSYEAIVNQETREFELVSNSPVHPVFDIRIKSFVTDVKHDTIKKKREYAFMMKLCDIDLDSFITPSDGVPYQSHEKWAEAYKEGNEE